MERLVNMPQEMQVLSCYSCGTFQVHIVKKIPKWECKICGEKQSVKKVYGRGSGKDCRLHVQQLNQKRLEIDQEPHINQIEYSNSEHNIYNDEVYCNDDIKLNRWAEFVSSTTTIEPDVESNEILNYTFEQPIKKRRCTQLNQKWSKINQQSPVSEANDGRSCSKLLTTKVELSDRVAANKEIKNFDYVFAKPFEKSVCAELKLKQEAVDQQPHINEKNSRFAFLDPTNTNINTTCAGVKPDRWGKFISTPATTSDVEIVNYDLSCESPTKNIEGFEIFRINSVPQKPASVGNPVNLQEHKLSAVHFQASSKWNEFKQDAYKVPEDYIPSDGNSALKLRKGRQLFDIGDNDLDSMFTFQ